LVSRFEALTDVFHESGMPVEKKQYGNTEIFYGGWNGIHFLLAQLEK